MPSTSLSRAAVYRVLYGEDFIEKSINSILASVDAVYVFWTNKVWGDCKEVEYQGEMVRFPEKFDNVVDVVRSIDSKKIKLIEDYYPTPFGQHQYLVNNFVPAKNVVLMEPDQVVEDAEAAFEEFERSDYNVAAVNQIEHWVSADYRIPQRDRAGPIFWHTPLPVTRPNGEPVGRLAPRLLSTIARNYGFCVSDKAMYWKHLTALAFSPVIGDSLPREDWFEEVWMKWEPGMRNLEISKNHPSAIPYAYET